MTADDLGVGLSPLPGGMSGETFLSEAAGQRTVVRIYAGRSRSRGPLASETDAAVLAWVGGIVPVPQVLEVRRGDPDADVPALLVTSFLPGTLLEDLLPSLEAEALARVGDALGVLLGRLAHVALTGPGEFRDRLLAVEPFPRDAADLPSWVDHRAGELRWSDDDLGRLGEVADHAQDLLDTVGRSCLVHGDLNPKNLLVDPATLAVTGVLDWEYAHGGSPYADLGNLLRFDRAPAYVDAVLAAREALVPDPHPDVLDLARAADLFALVDLAARAGENPVADRAASLLLAIARSGDLHRSG